MRRLHVNPPKSTLSIKLKQFHNIVVNLFLDSHTRVHNVLDEVLYTKGTYMVINTFIFQNPAYFHSMYQLSCWKVSRCMTHEVSYKCTYQVSKKFTVQYNDQYIQDNLPKLQGSISQRVRTSPNLRLILGDIKNAWLVLTRDKTSLNSLWNPPQSCRLQ